MTEPSAVASAGRSLVMWLTVLQGLNVVGGVSSLALLFVPARTLGLPAGSVVGLVVLQVLVALVTVVVLQLAKGWLTNVRSWTTGEGAPDVNAVVRQNRTLSGWLRFGQWFPIVALPIVGALVWYAADLAFDPAMLEQSGVTIPDLPQGTTLEQVKGVARLGVLLSFMTIGLPSLVINYSILGWIRRWMNGVADAVTSREVHETRLPELSGTLARWFTFFQGLLVLLVVFLLFIPLLPTQSGVNATLGDRLNLLLLFLQVVLLIALLQWSKTFMFGVTRKASGQSFR